MSSTAAVDNHSTSDGAVEEHKKADNDEAEVDDDEELAFCQDIADRIDAFVDSFAALMATDVNDVSCENIMELECQLQDLERLLFPTNINTGTDARGPVDIKEKIQAILASLPKTDKDNNIGRHILHAMGWQMRLNCVKEESKRRIGIYVAAQEEDLKVIRQKREAKIAEIEKAAQQREELEQQRNAIAAHMQQLQQEIQRMERERRAEEERHRPEPAAE